MKKLRRIGVVVVAVLLGVVGGIALAALLEHFFPYRGELGAR